MTEKDKYHVRTLEEVDKNGRVVSTTIVKDLDAMLRDCGILPPEKDKKKGGKLIPFPK